MNRKSFAVLAGMAAVSAFAGLAVLFGDANASCAFAQGNACATSCRAAYNDCRIATKGSASCDAQFQACMRGCLRR